MNKWLLWISVIAGCGFGDNLTAPAQQQPDGGRGITTPPADASIPVEPIDGSAVEPTDAGTGSGSQAACSLVPQSGCTGATPACDLTIPYDGTVECRAVTKQGASASHCPHDTDCRAGYTCLSDTDPSDAPWCARLCEHDSDCVGIGSFCTNQLTDGSGTPIDGALTCTNACKPFEQTGCPSGMGCIAASDTQSITDCAYMKNAADGAACVHQTDCTAGSVCVGDGTGSNSTCEPFCIVGDDTTCSSGDTCASFTSPFILGTVEYGVCQ